MKKTSIVLGKMFLGVAVLGLSMTSCKQEPKQEDPQEVAEDANEEKFGDMPNDSLEDDSDYIVKAVAVDQKEIALAKLAQTKSTNADVKAFAKQIEEAHAKSEADIKALAAKKNITVPAALSDNAQDKYADLNDKSGADFDKAYADAVVDGHQKFIEKLEKAADKAKDPDIKLWAANALPGLREHLEHAKTLKAKTDALK
jgi:putative membrane protein